MHVGTGDGFSVDDTKVKQKFQVSFICRERFDAILLMLCSLWIYLEGKSCKGCGERKIRFREAVRVLCASRCLDKVKQHMDVVCFCKITEL